MTTVLSTTTGALTRAVNVSPFCAIRELNPWLSSSCTTVSAGTEILLGFAGGLGCTWSLFLAEKAGTGAPESVTAEPNQRLRATVSPVVRRKFSRDLSPDRS